MGLGAFGENRKTAERLMEAICTDRVSHAYIFAGSARSVSKELARAFAKAVLCETPRGGDACGACAACRKMDHGNYEDYIEVSGEGGRIKDETVVELQGRLAMKPYAGSRHVVVIEDADTMTLRAQNRLLKTLEEPAPGTLFLLLCTNTEGLAATILSRCVLFRIRGEADRVDEELQKPVAALTALAAERAPFYRMAAVINGLTAGECSPYEFLDALERRMRDIAVCRYDPTGRMLFDQEDQEELCRLGSKMSVEQIAAAVAAIEAARQDLSGNINTGYALKNMILKFQ